MRFDGEETILCTSHITYIHNSPNLGIFLESLRKQKTMCYKNSSVQNLSCNTQHCDGTVGSGRDACISKCVSEMSRFTAQKAMACRNPTGALNI